MVKFNTTVIVMVSVLVVLLLAAMVSAGDTTTFEADVEGTPVMSIEVPDYISLGNVTKGSITPKVQIFVNNTGSVNVSITPMLAAGYEDDPIFSHLYFYRRASNTPKPIGEFSMILNASGRLGEFTDDYFYTHLDLKTNFNGVIPYDLPAHQAKVRFFIAAA